MMRSFYSEECKVRCVRGELHGGELIAPVESPSRVDAVVEGLREARIGEICGIRHFGLDPILAVHPKDYINFLIEADRAAADNELVPTIWPWRGSRCSVRPRSVVAQLGYYALAADTAISPGTWRAAQASANVALTAIDYAVNTHESAFGVCRPPGHHATADQYGGYCFINNAAIAAEYARASWASKVAIIDIDYHHGNGTQSIFYERADVLFMSIHADPAYEFPYYSGFATEVGEGDGVGYNVNIPLPCGAGFRTWALELRKCVDSVVAYAPQVTIISLGVDTFVGDPMGKFALESGDYVVAGKILGALPKPVVFLLEGGYANESLGRNVVDVLAGFDSI